MSEDRNNVADTGKPEDADSLGGRIMETENEGGSHDTSGQGDFPSLSSEDDVPWAGDKSGGFNVDLSELDDEQLVEFARTNPDGVRNQAKAQSALQRDRLQLKQREEEFEGRLKKLEQQSGTQMSSDGDTVTVHPEDGGKSTTINAERLKQAGTVAEFADILSEELNSASARIEQKTRQEIEREREIADLNRRINQEFIELANFYPEVSKPEVRKAVEQKMIDEGIRSPEAAYLACLAPKFRERQSASRTTAVNNRQAQQSVVGGANKTGGEENIGKQDTSSMTPKERRAAALEFASKNPDKFVT